MCQSIGGLSPYFIWLWYEWWSIFLTKKTYIQSVKHVLPCAHMELRYLMTNTETQIISSWSLPPMCKLISPQYFQALFLHLIFTKLIVHSTWANFEILNLIFHLLFNHWFLISYTKSSKHRFWFFEESIFFCCQLVNIYYVSMYQISFVLA